MNYEPTENQEMRYMTFPVCRQSVRQEQSSDYTLPDYRPEIRRLLHVSTRVMPPAKYVGGGRVELDGIVEYQILYIGADGELYSAPLTGEYSVAIPMENASAVDMGEGVCVLASTHAESVTPRVTGPRKLSLRTRMVCEVSAYGKRMMEERVRGEVDPESICVMQKEEMMADFAVLSGDEICLTEEIDATDADVRVISADGEVMIREAMAGEGDVTLDGEVYLCLLCAYPDGRVERLSRKRPFDARVEIETTVDSDASLRAEGYIRELAVSVEEGRILCEIHLLPKVCVIANQPLHYRSDLFSTQCPCEIEYGTYTLPVHRHTFGGNLTQSERLSLRESGVPEGASIVATFGTARFDGGEARDGKYAMTGQSRYVLVCEHEGEYSANEITLPLRYATDGGKGEVTGFDANATVLDCRARVNGDVLELDAELSICGTLMGEQTVRAVEGVSFADADVRPSGEMIICFPSPGEGLWDVAKRYRVKPAEISGDPECDRYVII